MMLMVTPKGPAAFLIDEGNIFHYLQIYFPLPGQSVKFHSETILDGELMGSVFWLHDLVCIEGVNLAQRKFTTRLGILEQDIIKPHKEFLKANPNVTMPLSIALKTQHKSYGLSAILNDAPLKEGLLFTPVKLPYSSGFSEKVYVILFLYSSLLWKRPDLVSIDLRIKVFKNADNKSSFKLYTWQGSADKYYADFTPDNQVLERHILLLINL
jgi:hypothetical protein